MVYKSIRDKVDHQLLQAYDAQTGFDLDHLEEFVKEQDAAEMAGLKDDPDVEAQFLTIPGPAGAPDLKIRVYQPKIRGSEPLPAVVFFHGGGFLFGTYIRQNDMCCRWCKNVPCTVISVDYRRAPRWKAPAPVEDGYAALVWVHDHAAEIGVDPERIALGGLSAGGNLAATVALMARDRKGPHVVLQAALYAELDPKLESFSAHSIQDPKVWCRRYGEISWDKYLEKGQEINGYISTLAEKDLSGLPPMFSYTSECDMMVGENMAYWQRLMEAGVPVEGHVFPGGYHCFEIQAPDADISQEAYELTYHALRRAFHL